MPKGSDVMRLERAAAPVLAGGAQARQGAGRRIALFVPSLAGGGVETCILRTAAELLSRGFRVDLVLCERKGPLVEKVPARARVIELAPAAMLTARTRAIAADPGGLRELLRPILLAWAPPHRLPYLPKLIRYLQSARPDALLSALPTLNLLAVWARGAAHVKTRIVLSERDTLSTAIGGARKWRRRYLPPLLKRAYLMADAIIAVSNGVADDLAATTGIPRDRITTVYNPVVDLELIAKARQPLEHPWFAPHEPPVILGVGRLHPQKDFATLIRAFARVRASRPARLVILGAESSGDSAYIAELRALPARLGVAHDVGLPGFAPNPIAFMSRAATLVLSSLHEGLGNVLIEALACGTPVVSTDCPSGPREILDHGRFGPLVPIGDDDAMAAAIQTALDDPVSTELLRSRAELFTVERAVNRYLELMFGRQSDLAAPLSQGSEV
jgi:glycosyltransferase involved in cell wall biosynthesis